MDYSFTDIFDIPKITELCESYTKTNGVVTALLDLEGTVHVKTGWQDICTKFHRVNPVSSQRCTESDTALAGSLARGEKYNVYHCKNGLVDVAVPVFVAGEHVGNFFTGQFFFESPDKERFSSQAKDLGFELIPYIDALEKVPIFSEAQVKSIMSFLTTLAQVIGEMGKAKLEILTLQESERKRLDELTLRTRQLEEAKLQLSELALRDPLTQLSNRREFSSRLLQDFELARRYKRPLSLAMIDTDFFKNINDTHGHLVGDAVLKAVGKTISKLVRKSDLVARIGGDEFSIIFPETEALDVVNLLNKIRDEIAQLEFVAEDRIFNTTCSIGVANYDERCESCEQLFSQADAALYQAKANGRNCVVNYSSRKP